jgi:hypothetical protein
LEITKQHDSSLTKVNPVIAEILQSLPAAGRRRHAAPKRNAMHYDGQVFECVDWSLRGAYMKQRHGITAEVANDALGDVNRVVIDTDYNSTTGRSVRIIGFRSSPTTPSR